MSKKLIVFGLCILLVLSLGATYRFRLSQYDEECLEYKYELVNKTKTICDGWESCLWKEDGKWDCDCYYSDGWG